MPDADIVMANARPEGRGILGRGRPRRVPGDPRLLQGARADRQVARRPRRCDQQGARRGPAPARGGAEAARRLPAPQQGSRGEAKAIVAVAKREAEALASETEGLADTLERRTKLAEEKIARAEAQAISEVRAAAVDAALAAAEKILRDKVIGATPMRSSTRASATSRAASTKGTSQSKTTKAGFAPAFFVVCI